MIRMVMRPHRITHGGLVNYLRAVGPIVTKKTIGNTIQHEGLKSERETRQKFHRGRSREPEYHKKVGAATGY